MTDQPLLHTRLQTMLEDLQAWEDPTARLKAADMMATLLQFHSEALRRLISAFGSRQDGAALLRDASLDELVGSMLLLHDLHPLPVRDRVLRALTSAAPRLVATGAAAELVEATERSIVVRVRYGTSACMSSRAEIRRGLANLIQAAAPDVLNVEFREDASPARGFVPIGAVTRNSRPLSIPKAE